jgi:hypothetical protein
MMNFQADKLKKKSAVGIAGIVLGLCMGTISYADPISHTITENGVDWTSAGVSGVGGGSGAITLAGITGPVGTARLYWHGIDVGGDGNYDNANVTIDGNPVVGTAIGTATTNCWGGGNSVAYRADVSAFIGGDSVYAIAGMSAGTGHNANGASIVVTFDDGVPGNNRDLAFFEGNDSNIPDGFAGEDDGWHAVLTPIDYDGAGSVGIQLHNADGQTFADGPLTLATVNGNVVIPDAIGLWDGASVPSAGTSRTSNGNLFDIHSFDITAAFGGVPGTVDLDLDGMEFTADCLGLILAVVDLPEGSLPNLISLEPGTDLNCTGEEHTVVATIENTDGEPQENISVTFEVVSGPNLGKVDVLLTAADGTASWTYEDTGLVAGTDEISACFTDDSGIEICAAASKEWEVCNEPPDCSASAPSQACIWQPNHKFFDISILGITDPDGDSVAVEITGVTSDEETATEMGAGGVKHRPDASGVGTDTASVRAERSGLGDGRVYEISFTGDDGNGGSCSASVQVSVPHDVRNNSCIAADSGQTVDATQ